MSQTLPTRQSDDIWPPIVGSIVVLPLTTTVLIVDMTTFAQSPALPQSKPAGSEHTSPFNQYLTIVGAGAFNVAFGPTFTSLSGLSTAATSTVPQGAGATQGVIPSGNTSNGCVPWPGGTPLNVRLPSGPMADPTSGEAIKYGSQSQARFIGLILPAGTTTVAMWVSSGA
jgi:hypothetical protein